MLLFVLTTLLACSNPDADTGKPVDEGPDDADADGYLAVVDCDDTDAAVHPGAEETWYDGVDQDCDGEDDDQDGDGHLLAEDCDDTDPTIYPDAGEVPDDGIDQDCDGADATGAGDTDVDDDGYPESVDCDDDDPAVHPGAADPSVDGTDQDCDGVDGDEASTDVDLDDDGYAYTVDCDDADAAVHPGAVDADADGVDQDCDGEDGGSIVPDADGDGYTVSVDCDDLDGSVHPGASDPTGDGVDTDCDGVDGTTSPADLDADGWASGDYGGADCDDTDAAINPDAAETAGDDVDSDCDGADFGVDALVAGDLVVTEIMYDPDAVSDADGEWFELYNGTGHTVNLEGLVVADDAAYAAVDIFTVETTLVAEAGARLVFVVNGDTATNGGIPGDYDYAGGGVNLNNSGDDLYVGVASSGGGYTTIDHVSYDELAGWPASKGMSIELSDSAVSASDNDSVGNWCQATSTAGTTTDRGSPGAASSGC